MLHMFCARCFLTVEQKLNKLYANFFKKVLKVIYIFTRFKDCQFFLSLKIYVCIIIIIVSPDRQKRI